MKSSSRALLVPITGLICGFLGGVLVHSAIEHSKLPEVACKAQGKMWLPDYYVAQGMFQDEANFRHIGTKVTTVYGCFDNPLFDQRDQRDRREVKP